VLPVVSSDKEHKNPKLVVLHKNICNVKRKTAELEMLLCSELKHVDVIQGMPYRTLAELSETKLY